jgi:hypothetical protein
MLPIFYEIMPEYPVLCTGINGILINFPSPGGLVRRREGMKGRGK